MTRRQVEGLIAAGRNIIILDQYVVKIDAWMPYHPGGDKAMRHMVGRDATDEVTVYVVKFHEYHFVKLTYCACTPGYTLLRHA
jgi:sphingolipid 8-(E)-desaturase